MSRILLPALLLLTLACGKEEGTDVNPLIGNRYTVTEIIDKSEVRGFIRENGAVRDLAGEELKAYASNFSYTDANDGNFIGLVITFTDDRTVTYGQGSFAVPFTYTYRDNTVTVAMTDKPFDSEIRVISENRLERSTATFRHHTTSRTYGTDGADFYPGFVADHQDMLSEGDVFTYQTSTWVYSID